MNGKDAERIAALRAQVDEAHQWVVAGRYEDAVARFRTCLVGLRAALGEDHPEVAELSDDLETVQAMQGVAAFGQDMGFRWQDLGHAPGDGPPES